MVPPDRDLFDLTRRLKLKGHKEIPRVVNSEPPTYGPGRQDAFKVVDILSNEVGTIEATLHVVTEHAYWYVDDRAGFDREALETSARQFENVIYPSITNVFGPELSPGIDNDPHLTVLHTNLRGVAGYYSGADGYPREIHPYSNEREMLYMNLSGQPIGSDAYLGTLAHEFTHAVQFRADPSEYAWVNEGLAEYGRTLAGFPPAFLNHFISQPTVSLTNWPLRPGSTIPYYGAANHFIEYLAQQFGARTLRTLLEEAGDGVLGVQHYLDAIGAGRTFRRVFEDWLVASYLDDPADGVYSFPETRVPTITPGPLDRGADVEDVLPQYGARYYTLPLSGETLTVSFKGQLQTPLIPETQARGDRCWWSNRGDSIDSTLTTRLDLPPKGPLALEFSLWYEIEEGWDFGYVEVSTDGGRTWDILEGQYTFAGEPEGNAFGPGYTGKSDGWLQETVDLSSYAGQSVLVRFEYVTDDAVHGTGFCVADVRVTGSDFLDDGEGAHAGWEPRGFVHTNTRIPQGYTVRLVREGESFTVQDIPLDGDNAATFAIDASDETLDRAVLIVAATAHHTLQPAGFELHLS